MSNIKVSEIFYSIQGEGKFAGVPSVFLRTFGCNFTCAGFGMPPGERSKEADEVAATWLKDRPDAQYDQLPLVATGCDSYASWHPAFKHLSPVMDVNSVAERIFQLMPNTNTHLIITGGEPLLGWQRAFVDLLKHDLLWNNLHYITFETNGTKVVTEPLAEVLEEWLYNNEYDPEALTFSVSPKLSVSGQTREEAIKPEVVASYEEIGNVYLKYVIASEEDAEEALEVTKLYRDAGFYGPVYFMPVGGVDTVYNLNNRKVAELAMKHGVRYSDRLQVSHFRNAWGT